MSDDEGAGAEYADKAELIGAGSRVEEDDVKVTIGGRVRLVRVRGLTRQEVFTLQRGDLDTAMVERRTLALAMLRPRMSEGDIREWQDHAPAGELEPITDAVERLSGVAEGQAKDTYRRMEDDPSEEFRSLLSDQARDDRGPSPSDAER